MVKLKPENHPSQLEFSAGCVLSTVTHGCNGHSVVLSLKEMGLEAALRICADKFSYSWGHASA